MAAPLMSVLKGKPNYLKWNEEALQTFQKFTAFQCILSYHSSCGLENTMNHLQSTNG